jgi:DNA-directed RNA polymerase subunit RPC12/RpoP
MIETICPHCGHKIKIPKSVTLYVCICGKEYKIVIIKKEEEEK